MLAKVWFANLLTATAIAAPSIELELATERGVQITAPQEWLQLFTSLGIENVRIRTATSGDKPEIISGASGYHVVGIIAASNGLRLPGGMFSLGDRAKLRDYFDRLTADGAESLTAPKGRFGLTEKEFTAVFADLAQPINFETKGLAPQELLNRLQSKFNLRIVPDTVAERKLRDATPVQDDVGRLSSGTGLSIVLKSYGLALRPEKRRGEPVALSIVSAGAAKEGWPIGWDPERSPSEVAPVLMEFLNVEIDGYTLNETIDAIAPRIKLPIFWDHAALAAGRIDRNAVQISLPRTRTFYKRVLDRALAQAHLAGQLRVDEAGMAFYWITK
jgi:hypothetical protein